MIRLYHGDHNPPHIHIEYGECKAIMEITSGKIIKGKLPPRVVRLINEWRKKNLPALNECWNDAQNMREPKKIKPLE